MPAMTGVVVPDLTFCRSVDERQQAGEGDTSAERDEPCWECEASCRPSPRPTRYRAHARRPRESWRAMRLRERKITPSATDSTKAERNRKRTSPETTTLLAILHLLATHLFLALGRLERERIIDTRKRSVGVRLVSTSSRGRSSGRRAAGGRSSRSAGGSGARASGVGIERLVDDGSLALVGEASSVDVPDLGATANGIQISSWVDEEGGKGTYSAETNSTE